MKRNSKFSPVGRTAVLVLGISVAFAGITGCDKFKSSDDESAAEDDDDEKKEKAPTPVATASAETSSGVVTYPDMVDQSGTYRLLKNFVVFRDADATSERITGLARGTLINAKGTHRGFLLVDWPSGPGELSPGWIRARLNSPRFSRVEAPPTSLPVASTVPVTSASVAVSAAPEASAEAAPSAEPSATATAAPEASVEPAPSATPTAQPEASATPEPAVTVKPVVTAVPTTKPVFRLRPSFQLKKAK